MIINLKQYNKQIITISSLILIFIINLSIEYSKYLDFIDEEIYQTKVEVLSIYEKSNYNILRLKANDFSFFTKIDKSEEVKKFDILNMIIITKDISFLDYLKGFNGKNIYFESVEKTPKLLNKIIEEIGLIKKNGS